MKNIIILIAMFPFILLSCNKTEKENLTTEDIIANEQTDSSSIKTKSKDSGNKSTNISWYDKLIAEYVKKSKNELIKLSLKDNDIEWLLDRTEENDSTKFMVFNIGHDVFDEGEANKRFSSCGWIYIDSLKQKLYEYDLANDTLIEWKTKYYR